MRHTLRVDIGSPLRGAGCAQRHCVAGSLAEVEAAQQSAGVMVAEEGGAMHQSTVLVYGPDDLTLVIPTSGAEPDAMAHDLEKVTGA